MGHFARRARDKKNIGKESICSKISLLLRRHIVSTVAMQQDICKETAEVAKRAGARRRWRRRAPVADASERRAHDRRLRCTSARETRLHAQHKRRARNCALPAPTTKYPHYSDIVHENLCASDCVPRLPTWVSTEIVRIFLVIWHTYDVNNGAGIRRSIDSLKSNKC